MSQLDVIDNITITDDKLQISYLLVEYLRHDMLIRYKDLTELVFQIGLLIHSGPISKLWTKSYILINSHLKCKNIHKKLSQNLIYGL